MLTGALLLGIGLVAAGARLYGLDAKPLWLDETLSWRLQSFPLGLLLERTGSAATVHPPLHFVILHVWTPFFGDSHFALRLPSALFGVLSALAIYPLARDLAAMSFRGANVAARSRSAGLLASALVAISPYHIHAAHQARPYTLGILLAIVSTRLLLLALRARTPRRTMTTWLLYAVSVLGFLYTHHLGLFSVLAQGLFAAAVLFPFRGSAAAAVAEPAMWYRLARRWALVAAAVVIVGYLPWVPRVFAQSENLRTAWSRSLRPAELLQLPTSALLAAADSIPEESLPFAAGTLTVLLGVLAVTAWRGGPAGALVVLMSLVPPLLLLLYSTQSMRSIFTARYLAFAQPFWLIAFALLVCRPHDRPLRIGLGLLLVFWSAVSCVEHEEILGRMHHPGMPAAVERLLAQRRDGEPVIAQSPEMLFKLLYYSDGSYRPWLLVDVPDRHQQFCAAQLLDEDLVTQEQVWAEAPEGIWTFSSGAYGHIPQSELTLPSDFQQRSATYFEQDMHWERRIQVRHFRRE